MGKRERVFLEQRGRDVMPESLFDDAE